MRLLIIAGMLLGSLKAQLSSNIYTPTCNGTSADTALIQAVLNSIGTGGGEIILIGCQMDAVTIQPQQASLTFSVVNKLTLTWPLTLPNKVHLIGMGGGVQNQFQHGPAASVIPPPGTAAAIHVIGSGGQRIENISISYPNGPGIAIDGAAQLGALVHLINVSVLASNSAQSIPLLIDAAFWVWAEHCSFLSQGSSYPASVRVTTSNRSYSSAGLIYVSDSIVSGHGIQLDAQVLVSQQANLSLDRVSYESGLNSFLRIDSTNGVAASLFLNAITVADAVTVPYMVEELAAAPRGIRALSVRNTSIESLPFSNVSITGLDYQADDTVDYSSGSSLGHYQSRYAMARRGVFDGEWDGGHTANALQTVFGPTLLVQQDASQWASLGGNAVVSLGMLAPDGSATAANLSVASGVDGRNVYRGHSPLTVGDWIIAGVWIQSSDVSKPTAVSSGNGPLITMNPPSGNQFDNGSYYARLDGDVARRKGQQWGYVWTAQKIISISGSPELIFGLDVDSTHPGNFWMPWMMQIPTGSMSDQDVFRFARSVSSLPSGSPAGGGIVSLAPNQILRVPQLTLTNLPNSCTGQVTGSVWNNLGSLGVCP
jgi:hypothetical protein